MNKVRLNNFILWCKGWYEPIKEDIDFIVQAQKILVLDGYMYCNNPISISLIFIDELVEKNINDFNLNDRINIMVKDGSINAKVEGINKNE